MRPHRCGLHQHRKKTPSRSVIFARVSAERRKAPEGAASRRFTSGCLGSLTDQPQFNQITFQPDRFACQPAKPSVRISVAPLSDWEFPALHPSLNSPWRSAHHPRHCCHPYQNIRSGFRAFLSNALIPLKHHINPFPYWPFRFNPHRCGLVAA